MTVKYNLRIVDDAQRDILEIDDYISAQSPQNAQSVIAEIGSTIRSLDNYPTRFKVFERNADPDKVVHSTTVLGFVVYYRVIESEALVEVLTVRRGARDHPARFFR